MMTKLRRACLWLLPPAALLALLIVLYQWVGADALAVLLVLGMAPPATAYAIGYAATAKWWRSWIGFGLFSSSMGLALLIDISLLYEWLGDDYFLRDVVRLTVFALILAGCWLTFLGWRIERRRLRRERPV